jgi:hypothetical protein
MEQQQAKYYIVYVSNKATPTRLVVATMCNVRLHQVGTSIHSLKSLVHTVGNVTVVDVLH